MYNAKFIIQGIYVEFVIGMVGSAEITVDINNTAKTMGSGELEVFATPSMVALMEKAATLAIKECLSEGFTTVGTMINIKHLAATPIGVVGVTATATLIGVDGKRLMFKVEAFDGTEKIGEGQHERFVINVDRFMDRANVKR